MSLPAFARGMGWLAVLAVIATIAVSLWIVGSPAQARKAAADRARASSLQSLQNQVISYYESHKGLPQKLDDLDASNSDLLDPVTKRPYEYKILGPRRYRFCAVFETDTQQEKTGSWDRFSSHPKGRFCIDLAVGN